MGKHPRKSHGLILWVISVCKDTIITQKNLSGFTIMHIFVHKSITYLGMNINKTYIAFDSVGVLDHEHSNLYIFHRLADMQKRYPNRFHFINLESIDFSSTHDDLVDTTVKTNFLRIMSEADNLLLVVSPRTNVDSHMLNWQISRCVNRYKMPVIIAYAGVDAMDQDSINKYWERLPQKIKKYIGRDSARMCHIPLTMDKVERALTTFSNKTNMYPWDSTTIF